MLVLSRKTGQSIQIDDDIFVTVSQVRGGRVRLAIEAPDSVRIVRMEVMERDFGVEPSPIPQLETVLTADEVLN